MAIIIFLGPAIPIHIKPRAYCAFEHYSDNPDSNTHPVCHTTSGLPNTTLNGTPFLVWKLHKICVPLVGVGGFAAPLCGLSVDLKNIRVISSLKNRHHRFNRSVHSTVISHRCTPAQFVTDNSPTTAGASALKQPLASRDKQLNQ